ncbi:MAG: hypothetical protein QM731_14055 [Chitinophagaceae bacterium]
MRYLILTLTLLLISSVVNAQCDKKVKWISQKMEVIDSSGSVVGTVEDDIVITTTKEQIQLQRLSNPRQDQRAMIKETSCLWELPYKKGKTVYKAEFFSPGDEESSPGTMTIEATENGKITITAIIDKIGRKARMVITRYEEQP